VESNDATPLPVTDVESKCLDSAIADMVSVANEREIRADSLIYSSLDKDLCRNLDVLISETLTKLKKSVPVSPAEKLFERMTTTLDSRQSSGDKTLGLIFIRYLDTMEYMVSFHKKFRGVDRTSVRYESQDAHKMLRMRGLTKK